MTATHVLWMIVAVIGAGSLLFWAKYRGMQQRIAELEAVVAAHGVDANMPTPPVTPTHAVDATPMRGAGYALQSPPNRFTAVLDRLHRHNAGKSPSYRFPLGWFGNGEHYDLLSFRFIGEVNHILITGQSDSGKDNLAFNILGGLADTYTPERLQIAFIDGKGLDWSDWKHSAHTLLLATKPDEVAGTMQAITHERERRYDILERAGVKKWESYRGDDLPLLVVFVSELKVLETATSKKDLQQWLETELVSARAFGIRFILATQTATNLSTTWRSQINLYCAGYQPLDSQNEPNCGMTAPELESMGVNAIAPSALPAPANNAQGVFLAVKGDVVMNFRTTYVDEDEQTHFVKALPKKSLHHHHQKLAQIIPSSAQSNQASDDQDLLLQMLHNGVELLEPDQSLHSRVVALKDERSISEGFDVPTTARVNHGIGNPLRSTTQAYVELPLPDDEVPFVEQQRIIEASKTVKTKRQLCLLLYNTDGGQKSIWVRKVCAALGLFESASGQQHAA